MDHHKLRSAVFEKTGIKIDTTDPVFALVALNEAVLEEMFQRHLNLLQASHGVPPTGSSLQRPGLTPDNWEQDDIVAAASTPAANAKAGPEQQTSSAPPQQIAPAHDPAATSSARPSLDKRLLGFATVLGLSAALLVVAMQSLLTPGLTATQKLQLEKAEKLRQAIDQLDPKLKAQLPPELKQR